MITEVDKQFLKRAMRLAMNGRGQTEPNPSVGCVLVKNGQTIGEGWTQAFGGAHAEPTALADCKAKGNDPAGATAYVTLEPCCHTNKKTPPCAPRLIEAKIARVVIGCLDPNPDVNGKGMAMLREAGIEVECLPERGTGVPPVMDSTQAGHLCHNLDASQFQQLIAPFIVGMLPDLHERCYVTLKWAQSVDETVSGAGGQQLRISNDQSFRHVHLLRSRCDAIGVGIGTVIADNPQLTVRNVPPVREPLRFILDRELRTPLNSHLVLAASRGAAIEVFCTEESHKHSPRRKELESLGVNVFPIGDFDTAEFLAQPFVYHPFRKQGISHVLVEPGPTLAKSMLGWADRVWVFRCQTRSPEGLSAPKLPNHFLPVATLNLDGDILTEYLNTQSPAFFAPVPSADFVLAQEDAARATSL